MTLNSLLIAITRDPPFLHREENRNVKMLYTIDKLLNKALTTKIYSPWRQDRHVTWSSEPRKGLAVGSAKAVLSFFRHFNPSSPLDPNTNSPDRSPYISLKNWSREFVYISKISPSGDYFTDSHNIFSSLCLDFVGRKLTLVTLAT